VDFLFLKMFGLKRYSTIVDKSFIKQLISNPSASILIDVREKDEVAEGAIPTSKNISVQVLDKALHLEDMEFKKVFKFEKPKQSDEIVFYCRSGKRSAAASAIAEKHGYQNIFDYSGSWIDWSK
jgi:thiosulfate:glutathione sulfurtransferase